MPTTSLASAQAAVYDIADFAGLTGRLIYLQDQGVTAIWLLPFLPVGPIRDEANIADYGHINPMYGTLPETGSSSPPRTSHGMR